MFWLDVQLADTCLCVQPVRLLAAVLAKNAVGSSWRKMVDSREWSRVSLDEKRSEHPALMILLNVQLADTL